MGSPSTTFSAVARPFGSSSLLSEGARQDRSCVGGVRLGSAALTIAPSTGYSRGRSEEDWRCVSAAGRVGAAVADTRGDHIGRAPRADGEGCVQRAPEVVIGRIAEEFPHLGVIELEEVG